VRPWVKIVATTALVPIVIALAVALYGLSEARRDPIVRQARIPLTDWPVGAAPVRAVLISDVHLGSLAMDRGRLDRIVDRIDTLKPDIVLIAGDFINGHEAGQARRSERDLGAALNRLHAPLGVVAVLGNHDYYTDAQVVRRALARANVAVLRNEAIRRGPLTIGGIDDVQHHHDDPAATLRAMARLDDLAPAGAGARVILVHDPELVPRLRKPRVERRLPDIRPRVVLAGHTHCGQVALPGLGPILTILSPGDTFFCGPSRVGQDRLLVTSGLGTSILPMRIATPPDLWLITFGPVVRPTPAPIRAPG